VALCHLPETYRTLALVWGVHPLALDEDIENSDALVARCKQEALQHGFVAKGDTVLLTAGLPPGAQSTTNLIKVETID
jgi:pyruvate kinase